MASPSPSTTSDSVTTAPSTSSSIISTSSTPSSSSSSSSSSSTPSSTSIPSSSSAPSSSSTPSSPTSSASSQTVSTGSDGGLVTITYTQTNRPTQSPTGVDGGGGSGFFDNKAQVAAVFSVAGIIGLVLVFLLITTCIRRRRARKFDRDVSEAAAAAAAASADPFFEDEERGANWDPRRTSTAYGGGGYGKLNEDPHAYAAAGVMGGAGFARNGTQYSRSQRDQYGMNDLNSSGHPSSGYTHSTGYTPGANSYYAEQPQMDYGRPSFGSNAPGIAGVGSGGGVVPGTQQPYGQENQNLRYRGGQQHNNFNAVEDAYGGYTTAAAIPSDGDRYPNPYASPPPSTIYSPNPVRRSTGASPPLPPVPMSNSSPPRSPPRPPPSYSGHGHGPGQSPQGELLQSGRPLSANIKGAPLPPPNMPLPPAPGPGTPEESWNDRQGVLRVANE